MKNFKKAVTLFTVAIVLLTVLSGCHPFPEDPPVAMVILAGNHANSKIPDVPIQKEIYKAYSVFGSVCIVVVDGNPTAIRDSNGKLLGFLEESDVKRAKTVYKDNHDYWESKILKAQIERVETQSSNPSDDPEVDTLLSLTVAFETLNQIENYMDFMKKDGDDKVKIKKELIIYDTGLCTSGALSFLNQKYFKLIKCGVKVWENEETKVEVENLVESLYKSSDIPNLEGVTVTWYGLGKVNEPQPLLNNIEIVNLQYIWGEILEMAKATPSKVAGSDETGFFVALNADKTYACSQPVTPVFFWDNIGNGDNPELPPYLTEEKLGFQKDIWEFREDVDPLSILKPYADNLNYYPDMKILLAGSTADPSKNGGDVDLSEKRANAVREILVQLGVDSNRIEIIGLGAKAPWYDLNEWVDGEFITDSIAAKSNRAVAILPRNSEMAKMIMGDN